MEDQATVTVDSGAELNSQPAETETTSNESERAQAAEPASKPDIKKLLEREKSDPNFRMTDAEQDVYDAYLEKIDAEKSKPKEPEPKEEPEEEEPEEKPEPKPKAKPKEEKEEAEPEPENEPDDDAKALFKEVGAKNLKEARAKVKELRSALGGKDAQAVARLEREKSELINGHKSLLEALAKGDPKAQAFVEKNFGGKPTGTQPKPEPQAKRLEGEPFIDPDKFIDPESATLVNDAFRRQEERIRTFEEKFKVIEEERDRHIQDTVRQSSMASVIDEMASVAERIPALKGIAGFRDAARKVLEGTPDARLDVFSELFAIAKDEKCSLKAAFDIKRGRDFDRAEAAAREAGRKEAYNAKPNPSLSGATGGRGEASYQPVTDAMLEKWESDHKSHPKEWYDADDNIILSRVPKRAQHLFR